jgi:hypothetical protein
MVKKLVVSTKSAKSNVGQKSFSNALIDWEEYLQEEIDRLSATIEKALPPFRLVVQDETQIDWTTEGRERFFSVVGKIRKLSDELIVTTDY